MKRILITGGCGFIGHHTVEHLIKNTDWEIIIIDKLGYSSYGFKRLRDIKVYDDKRIHIFTHDFTNPFNEHLIQEISAVDYILHMGAETHVDNSISDPYPFIKSNLIGTYNMLEYARKIPELKTFVYFSTDEVFGPAPGDVKYKEWDRYNSTNPYSATKAGGEELALAWSNTFKVPVVVTHTMNVFGERQHSEKFIPKVIKSVLNEKTITIHSDASKQVAGSRFYIHGRNVAAAVLFILGLDEQFLKRSKFNIVGEEEVSNLQMAQYIAQVMGKPLKYEMVDFHSSRPGHDLRYALDGSLLQAYGWEIPKTFWQSLAKTVNWYLEDDNRIWLGE